MQVYSGIADVVEVFTTEDAAKQRIEELLIDFDWSDDDLSLFAGEVGSAFEQLSISRVARVMLLPLSTAHEVCHYRVARLLGL